MGRFLGILIVLAALVAGTVWYFSSPDIPRAMLEAKYNAPAAEFVMLPLGTGYLVQSAMPALASDETYQLWAIVNGSPVSIGVMGASPGSVTFTMASSPSPSELAITVQRAGGSLTPATTLVASGRVVAS